jgi:hypothetical protein
MAGVFSFISSGATGAIATYMMWGVVFLFVALLFGGLTIWLMVIKKSTRFIEINLETRKIQNMLGRPRKKFAKVKQMFVSKVKKFLPNIQENDKYATKGQDTVFLLMDKNGLHHTARLPTYDEIRMWYGAMHGIDIEARDKNGLLIYEKERKKFETIYLIPNPSEDLDWLGTQCAEANQEFTEAWWKHPSVMIIGAMAMSCFVFIITLIISKKM